MDRLLPKKFDAKAFDILFLALLICHTLTFVDRSQALNLLRYAIAFLFLLFLGKIKRVHSPWIFGLSMIAGISFMLNGMYHGAISLNFITVILNFAIGYLIYLYGLNRSLLTIFFYIFTAYLLYCHFFVGLLPQEIFLAHSRNHVSNIMLGVTCLYYVANFSKNRLPSLTPAIICFLVSMAAIGRGGIISSAILLGGLVIFTISIRKKIVSALVIALLIGGMGLYEYENIVPYKMGYYNFVNKKFTSRGRSEIINEYLSGLSIPTFILGHSWDVSQKAVNLSIHISYLRWHMTLGVISFVLYVFIIWAIFRLFVINKLFFVILLAILSRASTDHIMLTAGFIHGPLLILFLLISLKWERSKPWSISNHIICKNHGVALTLHKPSKY